MTIIEHALRDIDRQLEEARARLADAQQDVAWLEHERRQILDEAAKAQQQVQACRAEGIR